MIPTASSPAWWPDRRRFPEYLQAANAGTPDSLGSGIYAAIDPQGRVLVLDVVGGTVRIMQPKETDHG